jgi:RimJ/RimL family protein N-acetyltransferase
VVTDRLVLRRWSASDLDALAEVFAEAEVWEFPLARGMTREEAAIQLDRFLEAWDRDGFAKYAVELGADGTLVGCAGVQLATWFHEINGEVEAGWRFHPRYWGRGYATEAVRESMRIGFEHLGTERIVAVVEPANLASRRLAERVGLQLVRETVEPELHKSLGVYVLDRKRFEELAAAPNANGCAEVTED